MINLKINSDGNLEITATENGKEYINEHIETKSNDSLWYDLLESYSCNGPYNLVDPVIIGALTEAPIIADKPSLISDDGEVTYDEETKFYWFPDYVVIDEIEELADGGIVTFSNCKN